MKNLLYPLIGLLVLFQKGADAVNITSATGWYESASVQWEPETGVESYNVYYTGNDTENQKIDDQLIRKYPNEYRADVPGLAPGEYTLSIVPVINGVEGEASTTDVVTVNAFDRTGFAFSNDRFPGAYKADGTPKDNAVVLYVTENTKDKISLEVTGANENPCVGLQMILEGFKKGKDNRPLIVRLIGQVTDLAYLDKGDIVLENKNNTQSYITLEGIGNDAVADGWGIRVKNASNIEIRNIGIMNCNSDEGDNMGLQQNNDYIWVHHCDFFYGGAGGDSDQAKGDGALDVKKSTYVTLSYNHFWDTGKSNLLGLSEGTTEGLYITYHHNWYDHSDSRHPRVRYYSAHVYNNYYDGIAKYGVGSTEGSSVFVEGNYFRNCRYPMLTSMQGSDVWDESKQENDYSDMPTFSKEDGGTIKAFNNYMEGERRFVPYNDEAYAGSTVDFDAVVVTTRDEHIRSEVVSSYGSNTYNNFDTDTSIMYAYNIESPVQAKETVMATAGRMEGGDFSWTFNNAVDDASYAVNAALKTALINYQTSLVAIQGDSVASDNGGTGGGGGGTGEITGDVVHNFTLSGLNSEYFEITGNLSDSKGTVNYAELTLTQCLKIESSTLISFTTSERADLILVFNEGISAEIKVDDVSHTITGGMLKLTLEAGAHKITKDDSINLYLMAIAYLDTSIDEIQHKNRVTIFPNPVQNQLRISLGGEVKHVNVYTLNGRVMISNNMLSNVLDISSLDKGMYVIELETTVGTFQQAFIKK